MLYTEEDEVRAKESVRPIIEVARALKEAIDAAGSSGIPSGHLYAMVCGHMSLHIYQTLIQILEDAGLITCEGFLLRSMEVKQS